MDKDVSKIIDQIKGVDHNMSDIVVPILKDTIADYRKLSAKLIWIILSLILGITILGIIDIILVTNIINKYNDFLSNFEFGEDTILQDLDTMNGGDIVNSTINN